MDLPCLRMLDEKGRVEQCGIFIVRTCNLNQTTPPYVVGIGPVSHTGVAQTLPGWMLS